MSRSFRVVKCQDWWFTLAAAGQKKQPWAGLDAFGGSGVSLSRRDMPRLAQRFIAGFIAPETFQAPLGAKESVSAIRSARPSGTRHHILSDNPPMNRWAIFFRPAGLGSALPIRQFVAHFPTTPIVFVPESILRISPTY